MSKLVWDQIGERFYETGTDRGVLFVQDDAGAYPKGVVWNGLTAVTQSPSGGEASPFYADNIKYLNLTGNEDFGGTIEAYYSPEEFDACDGSAELVPGVSIGQQKRKAFGFSYRTRIGNDVDEGDHGYKIHLIYGAKANPSERNYTSVNESPEPTTLSWSFTTTPVNVTGFKPTAHLEIDSTKVDAEKLAAFEAVLYGSESEEARMPMPDEVAELIGTGVAG